MSILLTSRLVAAASLFVLAPFVLALPAQAHVTASPNEGAGGGFFATSFRVSHGCGASPTVALRMTIPDGVLLAKPQAKPGWTITMTRRKLDTPASGGHGARITETVSEIVWRGTLPNDLYDTFGVMMRLPETPGATLYFPVVQECAEGRTAWTDIPAPGQAWGDVSHPPPFVRVLARPAAASAPATATTSGAITVTGPWLRATPSGAKVAGGYLSIANSGGAADRLVGGTIEGSGRLEIHEMTMQGDVMRMRQLPQGVEVKPGETVELKPGGLHIMAMDLKGGYKAGQRVKGTLQFEKAGAVAVEYSVAPVGASGPAAGGHHHH